MRTRIIKIGNSKGIRIPNVLLEESGLRDEVELEVQNKKLIIHPKRHTREGWEDAFRIMTKKGDDRLFDKEYLSDQSRWDEEEWNW